jgi:crotonobetainyl-CoA:carnitine CoA-transferase CaiB-like acyl-CoA transferase
MAGALNGITVADFSRVLAGPYATMMLADLGARVIKVERPGSGDDTRAWGPPYASDGQSTYFHSVNRNKESVALDLKNPDDRERASAIASTCDVMIENFLPGTLSGLGLGYDDVRARNPEVIYCSISGFGSGAGADLPGYDLLVQAMGGLMSITGPDQDHPSKVGVALVDVLTGLHAAVGILAALHHRDATGRGQYLEVSLMRTILSSLVNQASGYVLAGQVPTSMGNAHPSIAPYEVYMAADRPIVLAVGNDGQFHSLARVIGDASLADDTRFVTNSLRVANRLELNRMINARLSARDADFWQGALNQAGVPCGPINSVAQAFELAESLGLAAVSEIHDPRRSSPTLTVSNPIELSGTPIEYRTAAPEIGEDA